MADDGQVMAPRTDAQQLLRIWLSPSFPVGAFAYSHGLEAAAARGLVTSRDDLEDWLRTLLRQGSVRNDLVLLAAAWGAVCLAPALDVERPLPRPRRSTRGEGVARFREDSERDGIADINALALALQPSAERYLETSQQGGSFVATCLAAWPCASLVALRTECPGAIAYPVALGVAAAGHGIALGAVLEGAALAFVQNLVSAAIRLSINGQTDGQRVVAALIPDIAEAARWTETTTLDDLGAACFSSDLVSLEHETLGTRLFRS